MAGWLAGCYSHSRCDWCLLVYVCLNGLVCTCMGNKKVMLSRVICPKFC